MNELQILGLVASLVAPVVVGWAIVRIGWLEAGADQVLTWLFLHVCTPPLIIVLLAKQALGTLLDPRFILATLAMLAVLYLGLLLVQTRLLRRPLPVAAMAAFAGTKFNTVIVGLPVLLATIGHHAIVPTVINLVAGYFTILPATLLITGASPGGGNRGPTIAVLAHAAKKAITHPLVVATCIGLLLAGLDLPVSGWLEKTLMTFGNAAIPLALIAIGMSLASAEIGSDAVEIAWMSAVRVILSPTLAIAVAILFDLQPVFAIALVVSFSLPTAKMVLPLAEEQGVYVRRSAGIITTTTVSMLLVCPIVIWSCERLWPGIIAAHG